MGRNDVAVVGIGCRLPGSVNGPEDFWRNLCGSVDSIVATPSGRWDLDRLDVSDRVKRALRQGGFLDRVDMFDAGAFGISRREAREMDPQQRLLAEVTWQALEDAGIPPSSVAGSSAGVFVGISTSDYGYLRVENLAGIDAFSGTGNAMSVSANRLSYLLDAHGPSMAIDTACSSSLVAVHQACLSLRRGESELAIAAGVNVIASPALGVNFARAGVMAPDGRCKTFDAAADGYVRGEGIGVVVLKPLRAALRDRDRVYAVIAGSAMNQDGRTNGLMAPNPAAQVAAIRAALTDAGMQPGDVDYVELHGTGTQTGDAAEARALGEVFAPGRDRACAVGSVKTNIGHLEAAAGVVSLIKAALMIHHGQMPQSLHHHVDNPQLHLAERRLEVVDELRDWPSATGVRTAGVSAFGFGGTNAHAVLHSAPEAAEVPLVTTGGEQLLVASARSEEGLREVVRQHIGRLATLPEEDLGAYCRAAARRGESHTRRVAVTGSHPQEIAESLEVMLAERVGQSRPRRGGRLAFIFPGQGKQWWPIDRELSSRWPVFDDAVTQCDAALRGHAAWSLRALLTDGPTPEQASDPAVVQVATTAVQIALAALWRSWGVEPEMLVGHSLGEIAAAQVAGSLSVDDAMALAHHRGVAIRAASGRGLMAVVGLGAEQAQRVVEQVGGDLVSVASLNGPETTVLSGVPQAVEQVVATLDRAGVFARVIETVTFASHSPQMDGPSRDLARAVGTLAGPVPGIAMVSTVTGALVDHPLDADYWAKNLRSTVQFTSAVDVAMDLGVDRFVEVSGHPGVATAVADMMSRRGIDGVQVTSLSRSRPAVAALLSNVAELYMAGVDLDWEAVLPGVAPAVDLPPVPWNHAPYWLVPAEEPSGDTAPGTPSGLDAALWEAVGTGSSEHVAALLGMDDPTGRRLVRDALPVLEQWQRATLAREAAARHRFVVQWRTARLPRPMQSIRATLLVPASLLGTPLVDAVLGALAPEGEAPVLRVPAGATRADLVELVRDCAPQPEGLLVSLLGLDGSPVAGKPGLTEGVLLTHHLAQALADLDERRRLWLVTTGAVDALPDDRVEHPDQAMVWGMGRAIGLESPVRWGGLVDLPATFAGDGTDAEQLRAALANIDEDELAIRAGQVFVRRLAAQAGGEPMAPWTPRGTTLVTGATGGLGSTVARRLALRGAPHLVLMSRRGAGSPGAREFAAELAEAGTTVELVACDVADERALAGVLQGLADAGNPVRSVFHLAGDVSVVAPSGETTDADLARAVQAKVAGANSLDRLLPDLDRFVLFSSITGVWGSAAQGAYACANAFLDALAAQRRARGGAASSIQWGPWAGAAHDDHAEALARRGLVMMDEATALAGLDRALDDQPTTIVVAEMDWPLFARAYTADRPRRLLSEIVTVDAGAATTAGEVTSTGWMRRVADIEPSRRHDVVLEECRRAVGRVLRTAPDDIDADAPLTELGVDSLLGLEIRVALQDMVGEPLPATLVWQRPTLSAIADFLLVKAQDSTRDDAQHEPATPPDASTAHGADEAMPHDHLASLDDAAVDALLRERLAEFDHDGERGDA